MNTTKEHMKQIITNIEMSDRDLGTIESNTMRFLAEVNGQEKIDFKHDFNNPYLDVDMEVELEEDIMRQEAMEWGQ